MNRKLTVVSLSAICMAWSGAPASAGTVIGNSYQGDVAATNSTQSATNATGNGGDTSVLGDSMPVLTQNSDNAVGGNQALAGANSTLIASGPDGGFSQLNSGAVNSGQTALNGDSGAGISPTTPVLTQNSVNHLTSGELLAAGADNVIIGFDNQASRIGVNSTQSGNEAPGGGDPAPLIQGSTNLVVSEIVVGS